jgi:hypothetical protein
MRSRTPNPPRLVDLAEDRASLEDARILRAVGPVPPLDPSVAHRIEQRLSRQAAQARPPLRWAWALAALIVLGAAGTAAAHYRKAIVEYFKPTVVSPAPRAVRPAPAASPAMVDSTALAPSIPKPATAEQAPSARHLAVRSPRGRGESGPAPIEPASALARESETIGRAMSALRRDTAPREALRVLDGYDQEFPSGSLRTEALVLRIDALVAMGDERAALARLTEMSPATLAPLSRLRLLRADLHAKVGDCSRALADYDGLLGKTDVAGELRGDALFGRAMCRAQLGKRSEAERDYRQYLEAFPNGRYASKVRAALGQ